ncbi:MAG: efflux RND transporter periplasmic adaptor subunit [Bacteroidota bacterium]|nr:efflux RND transporter periplasmic adaptor subunit [Bacteroidota bacterium]
MKIKKVNKIKLIIYPVIACMLVVLASSCKKNQQSGQMNPAVRVVPYTVGERSVAYYDAYPGSVEALNEVEIHSEVSGYITGIFFKEGSKVAKGQKLYEIDRRKYQAALDQAKANVNIAQSNLDKAQRDADRYTSLIQQNAVARQVYDNAMTSLEDAKSQVKAAESGLLNAQTDYNYSLITAPFSGTIGFSQVKPGTFVVPGQTLLTTVSTDDPIGVDFYVNEKLMNTFLSIKNQGFVKTDSTFRILLPDNTQYQYSGMLSVLDRAVDRQTGTLRIRLVYPNAEGRLRPGMNCKVEVLNTNSGNRVLVPFKAVIEQMGEYFVYQIENNNMVKQVRVQPDLNLGEFIAVSAGVKPGDEIVLDGIQKLHNGSAVATSGQTAGSSLLGSK